VLQRRETLTTQLVRELSRRISRGELKPGDKLPSEQHLIASFKVSRTVVREAISSLKAEGLVSTRQGVGAFVLQRHATPPFRVNHISFTTLKQVIDVLELRIGVEAEAAALAAERRTDRDLEAMRFALDRMTRDIEDTRDAVEPDLDFHRCVAEATSNPHFTQLFNSLGTMLIPRARVETFKFYATEPAAYLRLVNGEHDSIFEAIKGRDTEGARLALRRHLANSRERLRLAYEQHHEPETV
jgi:GntR family transcriptional regulator, transcriptional repressor for pyruvate dehydrogenase complex